MQRFDIHPGNARLPVNFGSSSRLTNLGPGTVSYADSDEDTAQGTLAPAATVNLSETRYLWADATATVRVEDLTVGTEIQRLETLEADARTWFPVPTGSDDAAELISRLAAGETHIAMRENTYAWNQALGTIPADASIQGAGKRATIVNKGFSGTLATLADGVQLKDMKIDGKGAARTGKGFLFAGTDGRQSLSQVEMVDMDDYCLDFATAAGSQSEFIGCKFARYNGIARDVYSVRIDAAQQLAAIPRKFIACETDGTPFIDLGGCNDLHLMQGYWGKLKFGAESRGVVAFGRFGGDYASESPASTADTTNASAIITNVAPTTGWANGMHITGAGIPADTIILSGAGTAAMTLSNSCTATAAGVAVASSVLYVRGYNHDLKGDFAPQVVIAADYSAITVQGTHNNAPALDLSAFSYRNIVDSPRSVYQPEWQSSGVAPTVGNGAIVGDWSRQGSVVHFSAQLTVGSTSTFGTGFYRITLPMAPPAGINQSVTCLIYDSSANLYYVGVGVIGTGLAYVSMQTNAASGVAATSPITFATGDLIRVSGSYQL